MLQPTLHKVGIEQKSAREFILNILRERKDYLGEHINFFQQAEETLPGLIIDTQKYRDILFINSNFY